MKTRKHFALTNFDETQACALIQKATDLEAELKHVTELRDDLEQEVKAGTRKTDFRDKKAVADLSLKQAQLTLSVNKITDLETAIGENETAMNAVANAICQAVDRLYSAEKEVLQKKVEALLLPVCENASDARTMAAQTFLVRSFFGPYYFGASQTPARKRIQDCLALFDSFEDKGTFVPTFRDTAKK